MRYIEQEPTAPEVGTPGDWEQIEAALGWKGADPSRRQRLWRDLASIFELYLTGPQAKLPDPRPANYRRALGALRRHAVRLFADLSPSGQPMRPGQGSPLKARDSTEMLELLSRTEICDPETLPPEDLNELDLWALAFLSRNILPHDKHRALLGGLAEVIAAADKIGEQLPKDKGGRPRNDALQGLIYELAQRYRDWSGKEPGVSRYPPGHRQEGAPGGPFFRFVTVTLRMFAPERAREASDEALAKTIQRVLRIKDCRRVIA